MAKDYSKVVLGNCEIALDDLPIGMTRDNTVFTVERTYHEIKHNGSRGKYVGGVCIDEERAKLKFSFLELYLENIAAMFPAVAVTGDKIEPTFTISETDYKKVTVTGLNKNGESVKITLQKGFNSSNIELTFADKDEVATPVEFEACYADDISKPWAIEIKESAGG